MNIKKNFTTLSVGREFELFKGKNMKGQDGCVLEQFEESGFCLVVYMDNITDRELGALREAKIKVKAITEADDFVLTMVRYGNTQLIFEMSFDPTLYKDDRREQFSKSNMLTIIGVDSSTNTIKSLRHVSMPLKLHNLYIEAWSKALLEDGFSKRYINWVNDLDKRYSVLQLWEMGNNYGIMGQEE